MTQNTYLYDYFVHEANQLLALGRFYVEIDRPIMTPYDREFQHYVLTYTINSRSLLGRLILLDHYNFLVQQEARTASVRTNDKALN